MIICKFDRKCLNCLNFYGNFHQIISIVSVVIFAPIFFFAGMDPSTHACSVPPIHVKSHSLNWVCIRRTRTFTLISLVIVLIISFLKRVFFCIKLLFVSPYTARLCDHSRNKDDSSFSLSCFHWQFDCLSRFYRESRFETKDRTRGDYKIERHFK